MEPERRNIFRIGIPQDFFMKFVPPVTHLTHITENKRQWFWQSL
jgi:hypothetical protein